MDFFKIRGRSGPNNNILRLDFLFHICIVNIANCILIKKKYEHCSHTFMPIHTRLKPKKKQNQHETHNQRTHTYAYIYTHTHTHTHTHTYTYSYTYINE